MVPSVKVLIDMVGVMNPMVSPLLVTRRMTALKVTENMKKILNDSCFKLHPFYYVALHSLLLTFNVILILIVI